MSKRFSSYQIWLYPTFVWLVQLIATLLIAFIFSHIFPGPANSPDRYPMFHAWDGGYYLQIAQNGYTNLRITAFYPLYPLLMHILHLITGLSYPASGFIISNFCFLIALIYLYRFTSNIEPAESSVAKYTLWLVTVFPVAFFYHCVYTESTNLMFLLLFFYFLQQNRWYLAMIAGGFAAITHGFAMLLILPALIYLWQQRNQLSIKAIIIRIFSLLIIYIGVILYMIYLYNKTGTPFAFVFAHKFWKHESDTPVIHILLYLYKIYFKNHAAMHYRIIETVHGVFALFMVLMGVLMITLYWKKFNLPLKVFYIVSVLLSISSGPGGHLDSFARYEMVLFPGFIVWAFFCQRWKLWFMLSLSLMLPLETVLLGTFVNGYWIT